MRLSRWSGTYSCTSTTLLMMLRSSCIAGWSGAYFHSPSTMNLYCSGRGNVSGLADEVSKEKALIAFSMSELHRHSNETSYCNVYVQVPGVASVLHVEYIIHHTALALDDFKIVKVYRINMRTWNLPKRRLETVRSSKLASRQDKQRVSLLRKGPT